MAKKEIKTQENATPKMSVKEALENIPNLSLRKIALAVDVSYGVLLKASKKPVAGVPYDPANVNYAEIDAVLARKGIDISTLDLVAIAGEVRAKAAKEVDLAVGDKFTIRGREEQYVIVALTKTHICIQATEANEFGEEVLRSMSIATFLHQTPKKVNGEA